MLKLHMDIDVKFRKYGVFHVHADCVYSDGEYIVQKGSLVNPYCTNDCAEKSRRRRSSIVDNILQIDEKFPGSSAAASFCLGYNVNGHAAWMSDDGMKLNYLMDRDRSIYERCYVNHIVPYNGRPN